MVHAEDGVLQVAVVLQRCHVQPECKRLVDADVARVRLRDAVVAELGEPAPTDWLLAAVAWSTLAILGFVVVALGARALR